MQDSSQYQFVLAIKSEMKELSDLAREIWPTTFKNILSPDQIEYMLDWMYNPKKLAKQMEAGHCFYFLAKENIKIGFVGLEENYPSDGLLRIHKIYLKPSFHGQGLGKFMLKEIENIALTKKLRGLHLNVNRYNSVYKFYTYFGFATLTKEDIEIGEGYLMEDYVMQKLL